MLQPGSTTSTKRRHRRAAAASLVVLALGGAACSGDDEPERGRASTTTTAAPTTTAPPATTVTTVPGATTTTAVPGERFRTAMADLNAKLAAAGNDFCAIAESVTTAQNTGPPATPEDTQALYAFYKSLFDQIAANLPDSPTLQAGDADAIRAATERMMAAAAATGFDPTQVPASRIPPTFNEPDVQPVMRRISETVGAECQIGSESE